MPEPRIQSRPLRLRDQNIARLPAWPNIIRGTLKHSRLTCGNPGCRCRRAKRYRHGPYWYLSVNMDGRTKTRLLQDHHVPSIRQGIKNYHRWWKTCLRIFEINTQLALAKED